MEWCGDTPLGSMRGTYARGRPRCRPQIQLRRSDADPPRHHVHRQPLRLHSSCKALAFIAAVYGRAPFRQVPRRRKTSSRNASTFSSM
jgi:hypothetical protein